MKVILLQDVPALGRKHDMKDVSGGYARNFLLPRMLVEAATDEALRLRAARQAREERMKGDEEIAHRAAAERLKTMTLAFKMKIGEKGKAFGSVSAQKIADELKRQGIAADKDWIALEEPIKTAGERFVPIHFPRGIRGEIKLIVEAE